MPSQNKPKQKPRLNLTLKPPSEREQQVNESLFERLLGPDRPEKTVQPKIEPIKRSDQISDHEPIDTKNTQNTSAQQTPVTNSPQGTISLQGTESPVSNSLQGTDGHQSIILDQTPVTNSHQYIEPEKQYTKVLNSIFDELMAKLDPYEFKVYMRLYRLSYGFRKTQCVVGYAALSEACDLSTRHIKRVIPELQMKGLIKVVSTYNSASIKGTLYEVYAGDQQTPVTNSHQRPTDTSDRQSSNKDHDHDDFKKTDHHQSATRDDDDQISDHQRSVMEIYSKLTGNPWSKVDSSAYEKIKTVPVEIIRSAITATLQRAISRPNSLSYFVREILSLANPSPASKAAVKAQIKAIADRIRQAHIGDGSYSFADFSAELKDRCAKEGIAYTSELINEVIEKR
jgi:hypothetical protein